MKDVGKPVRSENEGRRARSTWRPVAAIVAVGVASSVILCLTLRHMDEQVRLHRFQASAAGQVALIPFRMGEHLRLLATAREYFTTSAAMSRSSFRDFIDQEVDDLPGLRCVFWATRVTGSVRFLHEQITRKDLEKPYFIGERAADGSVQPAKNRPLYFPIFSRYPGDRSPWPRGFDLASEVEFKRAMISAVESNRLTAARLAPGSKEWIFFQPLFRRGAATKFVDERWNALAGFVAGVIDPVAIFQSGLEGVPPSAMNIALMDDSAPAETSVIASQRPDRRANNAKAAARSLATARRRYELTLDAGGAPWKIVVWPAAATFGVYARSLELGALALGLALTTAVAALVHSYQVRADRIDRQVIERTEQLNAANESLSDRQQRLLKQQEALVSLIKGETGREDLNSRVESICRAAAETLAVDHVSVWRFNAARDRLCEQCGFDRQLEEFAQGDQLSVEDFPKYFAALERLDVIAADDAGRDERTRLLARRRANATIGAALDAPIFVNGRVEGVIRHRHARGPRVWQPNERLFAAAVGNLVANAFEQDERKRIAAELSIARDRYALATKSGRVGVWELDVARRVIEVEADVARHLGISLETMGSDFRKWLRRIHRADRPHVLRSIKSQLSVPPATFQVEHRYLAEDGRMRWALARGELTTSRDRRVIVGVSTDITDLKLAEGRLRDSERRVRDGQQFLASVLSTIPVGMAMIDTSGRFVYVNDMFGELAGRSVGDLIDQYAGSIVDPAERSRLRVVQEKWTRTNTVGASEEWKLIRPDGTSRSVHVTQRVMEREEGERFLLFALVDVTERNRIAAALKESEERWQLAIAANNDGIWDWNIRDGNVVYTDRWREIYGYGPGDPDPGGEDFAALIHPDDRETFVAELLRAVSGGLRSYSLEFRAKRRDGQFRWINTRAMVLRDENNQATRIVGSHTDITDRKVAEMALREQAELATLVADVGVALTSEDDLRAMLRRCAEALVARLGAALANIWTVEESSGTPVLEATAGVYHRWDKGHVAAPGNPAAGKAATHDGRSGLTAAGLSDADQDWASAEGIVAFAGQPLLLGDRAVGVLALYGRREFSQPTLAALSAVADAIALGIERKRSMAALRDSENRFRVLIEQMNSGVTLHDQSGRLVLANPRARELLGTGLSLFGWVGENPADWPLVDEADRVIAPRNYPVARVARTGEPIRDQLIGLTLPHDDDRVWLLVNSDPVRMAGGQLQYVITTFQDITPRVKVEAQLQEAKDVAEAANRAKSEFLSRMSHELRTPLNAVLGFAQLLQGDVDTPDEQESVEQILVGGRHLLDLINEVLDIARIESGRLALSLEPIPVLDLARQAVELIKPLAMARGVEISIEPEELDEERAIADAQRLRQVLLNLLSNAVKYNRERGSVAVRGHRENGEIQIVIEDTGVGIDPEKLDRLFTPFDRLGAERTTVEGTGLGLALSQRLAESMGGGLTVSSRPGVGSKFTVTLPRVADIADDQFARHDGPAKADSALRGAVLYIEDNATSLRLVERLLARRPGVRFLTAMQGSLGLELAREHSPDLIMVSMDLPDMSGRAILEELKREPATSRIPVVVIGADGAPWRLDAFRLAGASEILVEPLDVSQLLAAIDSALPQPTPVARP